MLAPAPTPMPWDIYAKGGPVQTPMPWDVYAKGGPVQTPMPRWGTTGPTVPVDTRTPQEKQKEQLAKFGALVDLAGNVAGMIPGLQPLRYAGDILNLIT